MTNQAANVVNLFNQNNLLNQPARDAVSTKIRSLDSLPLQVSQPKQDTTKKLPISLNLIFVLLAHALVIYLLATNKPIEKIISQPATPMMVSLIAPPSPEPELVPIIEPPKPEPKPIVKPKKVVEKIRPIEKPVERLVEATTEPPTEVEVSKPEAAPVLTAEPAKAPPKTEPIVEDKFEEPRFGVSYLNNPAPDYPALSRRLGEEGRVLMKVLVSADGAAETVQIEKTSGTERLDNAAMAAVKRWRFIPAKKNNVPLSAYVLVPMKFSLDS